MGTGLGLNIVYNLIKQKLNGNITCESESGKGVLFIVEVPV
jgi:signal transduction histidine kinase